MLTTIDNRADVIDSRDILTRITELQGIVHSCETPAYDVDEDDREELATLLALSAEGTDYAEDWEYGVPLIRDSYFQEYAQELADDIGAIPDGASWPMTCIDWERAARELQMDYTSVDFDGVTYWVR